MTERKTFLGRVVLGDVQVSVNLSEHYLLIEVNRKSDYEIECSTHTIPIPIQMITRRVRWFHAMQEAPRDRPLFLCVAGDAGSTESCVGHYRSAMTAWLDERGRCIDPIAWAEIGLPNPLDLSEIVSDERVDAFIKAIETRAHDYTMRDAVRLLLYHDQVNSRDPEESIDDE